MQVRVMKCVSLIYMGKVSCPKLAENTEKNTINVHFPATYI